MGRLEVPLVIVIRARHIPPMPLTTGYSFGDVVLVPFPFTNLGGSKKRPAVVISSADYQAQRRDLVIMAITIQIRRRPAFAKFTVAER